MYNFLLDLGKLRFLQYAGLAGLLSSVACGVIVSYVTVRRSTYIAGAISPSVLSGLGAARYLKIVAGFDLIHPLLGAGFSAVLVAIIIWILTIYGNQREDTVLSVIWAIGMAIGTLFIYATPGYGEDLMAYLFGNILMVRIQDIYMLTALDVIILVMIVLFYNKVLAISFDREYAALRGVRVKLYSFILLILTALTIVFLVQIVGIVMVIALLSLPAATASHFSKRFYQMIFFASLLNTFYIVGGLVISYQPNLLPGATIIILAGAVYLFVLIGKNILKYFSTKKLI